VPRPRPASVPGKGHLWERVQDIEPLPGANPKIIMDGHLMVAKTILIGQGK